MVHILQEKGRGHQVGLYLGDSYGQSLEKSDPSPQELHRPLLFLAPPGALC
jgi:hypothetical protein